MPIDMSPTQQKRNAKTKRLFQFYRADRPEVHEWSIEDEALDCASMSDAEVSAYLERQGKKL